MFRSLSVKNYRIWFIAALISNVGGWMQSTAQSWLVLTELSDNDALAVGITMSLQFGPPLLLVPIAGYVLDRFDRKIVLFVTQGSMMLLALGLGLIMLFGHAELWHVYLFALGYGIVNAFDVPARTTFVSDMVSRELMSNAVALNSASFNTARLVGPAIAGLLIVWIGTGWVFLLNAFGFSLVLLALTFIHRAELATQANKGQQVKISAGFKYVASRSDLMLVFTLIFIVCSLTINFPIFASTMAVEFGLGAGEYGAVSSVIAIGSLLAALMAARRERARIRVVVVASGLLGLATLLSAFMPSYWSYLAVSVLVGFGTITMLATANGYVQSTAAPEFRGRVVSIYTAVLLGATPFGAPVMGWIANVFSPRAAIMIGGAAALVAFGIGMAWLIFSQGMRVRIHPDSHWRLTIMRDHPEGALVGVGVTGRFDDTVAFTAPITIPKLTDSELEESDFSFEVDSGVESESGSASAQRGPASAQRGPASSQRGSISESGSISDSEPDSKPKKQ